ncbi:IS66 family insertion sequence element accessory protein TnpB [Blastomonas fulva]|uniref:IS66 family insertion sequence element accessory protein TnpB n=1 Tax=Blastomonas fulva TaxID=1550728 RepID=UPI003D2B30CD
MGQVTVFSGPERCRRWSDEERLRIVAEAFAPGARVADVCRRHDVSSGLIYTWRRKLRDAGVALMVQQGLKRNPHGGDLFVFRGRAGSLIKIIWHDGIGMSLYAKRLEKGRFVWPSAHEGTVSLPPSQLACLLEGIDWRNPQYTWRPQSAG